MLAVSPHSTDSSWGSWRVAPSTQGWAWCTDALVNTCGTHAPRSSGFSPLLGSSATGAPRDEAMGSALRSQPSSGSLRGCPITPTLYPGALHSHIEPPKSSRVLGPPGTHFREQRTRGVSSGARRQWCSLLPPCSMGTVTSGTAGQGLGDVSLLLGPRDSPIHTATVASAGS